nr:uncharacterized protein LOC128681794 [Plodia interpunctella]
MYILMMLICNIILYGDWSYQYSLDNGHTNKILFRNGDSFMLTVQLSNIHSNCISYDIKNLLAPLMRYKMEYSVTWRPQFCIKSHVISTPCFSSTTDYTILTSSTNRGGIAETTTEGSYTNSNVSNVTSSSNAVIISVIIVIVILISILIGIIFYWKCRNRAEDVREQIIYASNGVQYLELDLRMTTAQDRTPTTEDVLYSQIRFREDCKS